MQIIMQLFILCNVAYARKLRAKILLFFDIYKKIKDF